MALMSWGEPGWAAVGDPTSLDLKAVEGEGATYAPGSRATRGVSVVVIDEAGRPVEGATVSFTLPVTGPSGEFASGGQTEIVTTRADGRASVWGMHWNRIAGSFEIRVGAVKGPARAGITLTQNLAGEPSKSSSASSHRGGGGSHKWLWIGVAGAAALGGAVAAGLAAKGSPGGSGSAASTAVVQIGAPSVSLGRP